MLASGRISLRVATAPPHTARCGAPSVFAHAHANAQFTPGTPGDDYRNFVRATMDDDCDRTPAQVLVEALGDLPPPGK